ncbi:hypothetical protein [Pseudomonas syringae]|uniref:hypothetical protein n=1 Tax=Pseudomonas syringae TaxID=317 RepID=UPI000D4AFAB1|nr:hypothetical protein [Pseudomonas syringae]POR59503.1 hypothetical protein BKM23_13700 [Pseudomonas syringae pv. syringae]
MGVVFDENHPLLSKLDHALGYFMENETKKALVDTHFVVAVTPISAGRNLVPTGALELVRWFVLDKQGEIPDQQDVYANASEGLKAVTELTESLSI